VIREVARFWATRATYDPREHRYEIAHVTSVAESNSDIPNDTFTGGQHHLAFDPAVVGRRDDFGGGPISLLFVPSLDLAMGAELRRNDYEYAIRPTPVARVAAASMGIAPQSIAADTIGSGADAAAWFATNFTGGTLKPPFNVRTETAGNNTGYFLTGSAGYLQSLIYGFSGLRIREQGLIEAYAPVLPATWTERRPRDALPGCKIGRRALVGDQDFRLQSRGADQQLMPCAGGAVVDISSRKHRQDLLLDLFDELAVSGRINRIAVGQ